MVTAKPYRSHLWQLAIVVIVGLIALKFDAWSRENSDAFLGGTQWLMLVALMIATISRDSTGVLKSGPDRKNMGDVIKQVPVVGTMLLGYLLLLAFLLVSAAFAGVDLADHVSSLLANYVVFVPFVLIVIWGKYKYHHEMAPNDKRR